MVWAVAAARESTVVATRLALGVTCSVVTVLLWPIEEAARGLHVAITGTPWGGERLHVRLSWIAYTLIRWPRGNV